jgi:uncharacterized protein YigA (DUF484 family)
MAPGDENNSGNGQFKLDMAEFKGFVGEALRAIDEKNTLKLESYQKLTAERLEAYQKLTAEKLEGIKEQAKENHTCACQVRDAVTELQKQIAVSSAVRKVKDGLWGAIGGGAAMLIIQLGKDFLKAKVLGGK